MKTYLTFRFLFLLIALFGTGSRLVFAWIGGASLDILGYFTIQSNLFVIAFYLVSAPKELRCAGSSTATGGGPRLRWLHGAVALPIAITGIVYYALLLRFVDPHGFDAVLQNINHGVTPLLFLIDWCVVGSKRRVERGDVGRWFIYPAAYGIYGTVEGAVRDRFRYFFLDFRQPTDQYMISLGIVVAIFVAVTALLFWSNRFLNRRHRHT